MNELNPNLWEISQIWSNQIWENVIQNQNKPEKPDISMFDNAPSDVTAWSFFGKIILGFVVWVCVAALLFATLSALWWLSSGDGEGMNSIIWIILPVVWFIVWFVWNLALALLYNIFFSKRYYSFSKMTWLIFASLIICLLFFVPYFLYGDNMTALYAMLWFQIIFELFIAKNLIDFLSQPNYSASSLMWNTLWIVLAILLHIVIITKTDVAKFIPIIVSVILAYGIIAVWSWVWDAIYYKFYEWWNNPFYLPSLNELREERRKEEEKKAKEEEDVNVDMK